MQGARLSDERGKAALGQHGVDDEDCREVNSQELERVGSTLGFADHAVVMKAEETPEQHAGFLVARHDDYRGRLRLEDGGGCKPKVIRDRNMITPPVECRSAGNKRGGLA